MDLVRISILELQGSGPGGGTRQVESALGMKQFENFLDDLPDSTTAATPGHLYVVQAPSSVYEPHAQSKLKHLLRTRLGIPDDIFQIHQWRQTTFKFNETINCHRLPTTFHPKAKYSLEYFELWSVESNEKNALLDDCMGNTNTVTCAMTGRPIQCHKWNNSAKWLMIVPRKVSYWAKLGTSDQNNIVVLCDPPPTKVITKDERPIHLEIKAFEGGYHGFIPDYAVGTNAERPSHRSLHDDIVYYVRNHAEVAEPSALASLFLRKIVASHYCELLGFVTHQTASMRSSGWAVQRRTQQEIDESNQVEMAWSHFRCPDYLQALGTAMDFLGITQGRDPYDAFDVDTIADRGLQNSLAPPGPSITDWRSSAPDFLYLHREFRAQLADYARMTSSLAALNGMIGGRISLLEARTARSLTLVAMLFAPPACVASIFSIPSDIFGQNGPPFWWYWATAVPLTVLVFLCTYLVHERDVVRRVWQARKPRIHPNGRLGGNAKV